MTRASLIVYAVGSLILVPSLILLFSLFKGGHRAGTGEFGASTGALTAETAARHE